MKIIVAEITESYLGLDFLTRRRGPFSRIDVDCALLEICDFAEADQVVHSLQRQRWFVIL